MGDKKALVFLELSSVIQSRDYFRDEERAEGIVSLIDAWVALNDRGEASEEEVMDICRFLDTVKGASSPCVHLVLDFRIWVERNGFDSEPIVSWFKSMRGSS